MANYNKTQGIIEGLSDFWLLYFKEFDQLETLYRGVDILMGQAYLDMMSLLLNNSTQDAPLFNKEFFKLIQISEVETYFRQRSSPALNRFLYVAEENLVEARHLNNKIFSVTEALEEGADYQFDDTNRIFEFNFDPLNAYLQRSFGDRNSAFTLKTQDPYLAGFTVELLDDGTTPLTFSLDVSGTALTIAYDGPANGGSTLARDIVAAVNNHPVYSGLLTAELKLTDKGNASPAGVPATPLVRAAFNPLDGYASRVIEQSFGGSITCPKITNWLSPAYDIQKGDIIRLISGPTIATPQELPIALMRNTTLYTQPGAAITDIDAGSKIEFSILREPEGNQSNQEPFGGSGSSIQMGVDGALTAATRNFSAISANFSPLYVGDIIELQGVVNVGYARIISYVDPDNVILSFSTAVDEAGIPWSLISTTTGVLYSDGALTNNGDGTASFTSASAPFAGTAVGSVVKIYRAGVLERYEVINLVSTTEVTLRVSDVVADGAGLDWAWANKYVPSTTVAFPQIKEDSVTVTARRLVDDQAVIEGRDFTVSEDAATITPITVWRTSTSLAVTYDYRLVLLNSADQLQNDTDGTLTFGTPSTFTSPSATFDYSDIGQAIYISNSGLVGANNNGIFFISAITSANTVQLTTDRRVVPTADTNNGSLVWSLRRRAVFTTEDVSAPIQEMAFWAPNALVDRFHLYNTFGYLINRFENSSEAYRSLIRGVFQLFMLGPTLERFESAINTVSGLSVIRDDGEILIDYSTGSYTSGVDGFLDGNTATFTSASASFTATAVSDYIYISSGLNENALFKVLQVVSSTELILDTAPVTEGPVNWEILTDPVQTVITSRRTYTFDRTIPLRAEVTNPANAGVKIFSAFEVLSDVFTVTDYIETPTWWENTQIPEELWRGEDALRRQVSPALVENVINPSDGGRIGDPGFIIGADSQGFIPPSVVQYSDGGAADGSLEGDVFFPTTNNVYFETSILSPFTTADLERYLVVNGTDRYRIVEIVSTNRIRIESFTPVTNASGLTWQVESQPVALRHKAAFVIMDTWLKYHTFYVSFNPALLGSLGSDLIVDLQELVFTAKPTYTYIVLAPSTLLVDSLIITEEDIQLSTALNSGGSAGELILSGEDAVAVIGSSWRIGTWFRYLENTDNFSAPSASVADVLGSPDAGYVHHISKFVIDTPADFSYDSGTPIPHSGLVLRSLGFGAGATITQDGDYNLITIPALSFNNGHTTATVRITSTSPSTPALETDHIIGSVNSTTSVVVGTDYVADVSANWELLTTGSFTGFIRASSEGETLFTDTAGLHLFETSDVGDYIRFPFTNFTTNTAMRISYVSGAGVDTCKLATLNRVDPIEGDPDFTGAISTNTLTVTFPLFSDEMCYEQRAASDPSTALKAKYYIVFTSGANNGERRHLLTHSGSLEGTVDGAALTTDAAVTFYIEVERAYAVTTETAQWEHVRNYMVLDQNTVDLSNSPTQDAAATVSYTAYGVREPIDPGSETFDDSAGDTYYSIGMPNPRPKQGRRRTGRDTDLREDPIQITRT